MPSITISYRRASAPIAARIFDWLKRYFGPEAVFIDIESIPPGVDFTAHLHRTLADSEVMVAVIDPQWEGAGTDTARISQEDDWVGIEIATALAKGIPILPVLVDRTHMPDEDTLPPKLRDLRNFQAILLDSHRIRQADLQALVDSVRGFCRNSFIAPPPPIEEPYVVDCRGFAQWGWTLRRMVQALIDIDYATFNDSTCITGSGLTEETEGSLDHWVALYEQNPNNWTLLVKGERDIIGWSLFFALTDEAFAQVKAGLLAEHEFRPEHIVPIDPASERAYNIYYSGLAVGPREYRKKGGWLLFSRFVRQWRMYEECDIAIKEFCTVAYTHEGVSLCERVKLKCLGTNRVGLIYSIEGSDLANRLRWSPAKPHNDLAAIEAEVQPLFDSRYPGSLT
jgi:hypothetical protein